MAAARDCCAVEQSVNLSAAGRDFWAAQCGDQASDLLHDNQFGDSAESLPQEWVVELSKLQSSVPPFPTAEAQAIILAELGEPVEALYADFTPQPMAAASTAQVHRALLHSGQEVVVKVQRPNTVTKVGADLHIIQDAVGAAERRFEWMRHNNIGGIVNEFATNVMRELNYDSQEPHS